MQNVEEQPTSNNHQEIRQNQETVSRVPFPTEKYLSTHTQQIDYNLSSLNQESCIVVTTSLSLPPYFKNLNPVKSEIKTFTDLQPRFMTDSSDSDEDSVSEVECFTIDQTDVDEEKEIENTKFLLPSDSCEHSVDPETQARLEALLEAAGIGKLSSSDGNHLPDHEVLRRLTSSVSCAIDEAAAALTRMRTDNTSRTQNEKRSLIEACSDGDVGTVKKLLTEGRSVHETTEEGESLLSLACSAGYYELAQVLIAMNANIEDRGIKGDCTPLMEAASAGHVDIVSLLIAHGADVNAHSTSGNTPLMYACAGGHEEVVRVLLEAGADVEVHNDNGHTPLMEAASAGHVLVAKILLEHGAGINTHSNEFKESALTLACYKGHLEMVKFLLEAGADREHKTDEMHTALMEASMDGHVEVARLLLDSGAQVNMPTDSFESPLTLAACGGHVDLAMLLIERGANIEEVNDEGYTPLMEAAREGHEEMIALLLSQGANINAQTEETQETALTLACCGGFLDVTDFLIKAGADIELGASTPLMEAAQEGHLDLVRYLLETRANVHAQTQTGDTALTYACENGHTDVADLLLQFGAYLEHESEGGRTPLMKACRAGHLCTVQFLISKHADVNRQTTNNDHTPLSLACAGGHLSVVQLLLTQSADPFHKLKDNSTMLIEAAKGGHTSVVQLLLDYPHSIMMNPPHNATTSILLTQLQTTQQTTQVSTQHSQQQNAHHQQTLEINHGQIIPSKHNSQKSLLRKNRSVTNVSDITLTSAEAQQVRSQPPRSSIININEDTSILEKNHLNYSSLSEPNISINSSSISNSSLNSECRKTTRHEQILHKQQILEELQRVERELQIKGAGHLFLGSTGMNVDPVDSLNVDQAEQNINSSDITTIVNIDQSPQSALSAHGSTINNLNDAPNDLIGNQGNSSVNSALSLYKGFQASRPYLEGFREGIKMEKRRILKEVRCLQETQLPLPLSSSVIEKFSIASNFPSNSSVSVITVPAPTAAVSNTVCSSTNSTVNFTCSNTLSSTGEICSTMTSQPAITSNDVSSNTAISDRPKVKAVSKKDNKNVRKTVHGMVMSKLQQQHMALMAGLSNSDFQKFLEKTRPHCVQQVHQLQQLNQQLQLQLDQVQQSAQPNLDQVDSDLTRIHREGACPFFTTAQRTKILSNDEEVLKLEDGTQIPIDEAVNIFESISFDDINNDDAEKLETKRIETFSNKEQFPQVQQVISSMNNCSEPIREYFAVPVSSTSPLSSLSPLQITNVCTENQTELPVQSTSSQPLQKQMLSAFEVGLSIGIQSRMRDDNFQAQLLLQSNQLGFSGQSTSSNGTTDSVEMFQTSENDDSQSSLSINQVQVATQTQSPVPISTAILTSEKKSVCTTSANIKGKKTRYLLAQQQSSLQQSQQTNSQPTPSNFSSQNYQLDPTSIGSQYTTGNTTGSYSSNQTNATPFSCMDVDSETDSNHDTALTLACAGGHEELVELLLSRGADIEHRDKKGFTPLILAATAGHQKVVEILLNHGADIEAQSERTKDTPLSLACSGGRYEVVELLLNRGSNKEHRNVSDYTPLSLAASGGYVNIIKLLLGHGAEINSRTGSKLGISPLMLAAMNGHAAAVKLLLDMGSDINAQIETNRNTALTLACFQGRHEVVSLLLDRKANVEHRAKTGLTPLMEAASGGYVEVGRVLLNKGADVNATPVPSSRDTALTIAADKGHCRFVELLLSKGTQVEVKNKKGNSPLWLAANGGHLNVVDLLYQAGADIDSQDNRKVSCLMAAFRKGHIKVVKWMVNHVTQFPSDQEMTRYIATVSDKELLERCQECVKIIRAAKETQAAKANKNATILLEELDMEKTREESKKAAAARRRERKKKKKLEKKEEKRKLYEENKKNEAIYEDKDGVENKIGDEENYKEDDSDHDENNVNEQHDEQLNRHNRNVEDVDKEEGDSGIDANSQGSYCSNDTKLREKKKEKKKKKIICNNLNSPSMNVKDSSLHSTSKSALMNPSNAQGCLNKSQDVEKHPADRDDFEATGNEIYSTIKGKKYNNNLIDLDGSTSNAIKLINNTSPKQSGKRDEGWKEVVRKGQTDDSGRFMNSPFRSKKVSVPPNAISRVIGRGGSNINTIRAATGAHIEVEKQSKSQGERIITIKGSMEATKQAHILIVALIKDPEVDILQMLPKSKIASVTATSWDKSISPSIACKLKVAPTKLPVGVVTSGSNLQINKSNYISNISSTTHILPLRPATNAKLVGGPVPRVTAPRLVTNMDKKLTSQAIASTNTKTTMSYTSAIMTAGRSTKIITTNTSQTFAAKLSEMHTSPQINNTSSSIIQCNQVSSSIISILKQNSSPTISTIFSSNPTTQVSSHQSIINNSSNLCPTVSMISTPTISSHYPGKLIYPNNSAISTSKSNANLLSTNSTFSTVTSASCMNASNTTTIISQPIILQQQFRSSTPISTIVSDQYQSVSSSVPLEYSLFNDTFSKVTQQSMWGSKETETQKNINFATIAGARISISTSSITSNKFIDTSPLEVDASKAPGYRGTSMSSPTSNKPCIATNMCNTPVSSVSSTTSSPIQPLNIQSSISYTSDHSTIKSPSSIVVARPLLTQKNVDMNVTSIAPFTRPVFHGKVDVPQNIVNSHKTCNISSMSQNNTDVNIFNESNSGYDNQTINPSLLKIVAHEGQTSTQSILPIHQHIQNYPQTATPSATVTTTISMSRLNPRAPDFSSSLHLNSKPQVTMFSTGSPMHPNIYPTMPSSSSSIQSGNLTLPGNFAFNKFQASSQRQSNINIPTCSQNRWPFVPTANFSPHQDSVIGQVTFSDHLTGMGTQAGNIDMINLENGSSISPAISPSSTGQVVSQDISQIQVEDRKVPRPIGTERTWKNYSTVIGPGGDNESINWMINNEKHVNSWSSTSPNVDRNQIYCSNATFNRITSNDTDLHQIMETSYQGNRFGS